jgi:enamine deaminase RidA (YjgF/YER057c/UK114 family)
MTGTLASLPWPISSACFLILKKMSRQNTNRRAFLTGTLAGLAGVSAAADTKAKAKVTGLSPAGAPPADGYTPGILAEGSKLVFVSGRGPRDRTADMETQMRQTLEAIGKVLEAAGASMNDVVILRAYFMNIQRDLPIYRKVRKEFFSKPYPASTSIGVTALAMPDLQIEIEAVAVL